MTSSRGLALCPICFREARKPPFCAACARSLSAVYIRAFRQELERSLPPGTKYSTEACGDSTPAALASEAVAVWVARRVRRQVRNHHGRD